MEGGKDGGRQGWREAGMEGGRDGVNILHPSPLHTCYMVGNFCQRDLLLHFFTKVPIRWSLVSHQPSAWVFCDRIYHHYFIIMS